MEIEEAKEITKLAIDKAEEHFRLYDEAFIDGEDIEAIKTVLSALDNSVSKDKIKAKIEEIDNGIWYCDSVKNQTKRVLQELLNKGE